MERIEGVNAMPTPPTLANDEHRAEIAKRMVAALVRIHRVDWRVVGLADLGQPGQFNQRQVAPSDLDRRGNRKTNDVMRVRALSAGAIAQECALNPLRLAESGIESVGKVD